MAKKKAGRKMKTVVKSEKSLDEWERQPLVLQMRGSKAWREWARRFAKHCGVRDLAALVDFAFQQTARQQGFTEEPPARWIEKKKED